MPRPRQRVAFALVAGVAASKCMCSANDSSDSMSPLVQGDSGIGPCGIDRKRMDAWRDYKTVSLLVSIDAEIQIRVGGDRG